jgi:cell shape-determining protein MreC
MFRSNRIPLFILVFLFLILFIFVPSYGSHLRSFLSGAPVISDASQDLAAQNDALKAEISEYQAIKQQLPDDAKNYTRAMVYSRYPLNFRNEFSINAGTVDGVSVGQGVLVESSSSYVLIGRIISVSADSALVQTVFDPAFKIAVRVGSKGYDGLLEGGTYPKVGSIAKNATLAGGDVISSADASLPYGIAIGEVSGTNISPDNLFEEAQLVFPYDINTVQTVLVRE